jgi:excisionase family DNA binding protein
MSRNHTPPLEADSLVLTVEEAAKLLRIGRSRAYEAVKTGAIPTIRIGRRILVPRARMLAMLERV